MTQQAYNRSGQTGKNIDRHRTWVQCSLHCPKKNRRWRGGHVPPSPPPKSATGGGSGWGLYYIREHPFQGTKHNKDGVIVRTETINVLGTGTHKSFQMYVVGYKVCASNTSTPISRIYNLAAMQTSQILHRKDSATSTEKKRIAGRIPFGFQFWSTYSLTSTFSFWCQLST